MKHSEIGSPDPKPLLVGKYDIPTDERAEIWKRFKRYVDATARCLSDLPVTLEMVTDEEGLAAIELCVTRFTEALRQLVKRIAEMAPMYYEVVEPLRALAKQLTEACHSLDFSTHSLTPTIRLLVATVGRDIHNAVLMHSTFDVEEELAELQAGKFYAEHTKGISSYINDTTERLCYQMGRRPEWRNFVADCEVALDDQCLQEYAEGVLKTQGCEAFRHLLVVASILREHRKPRHKPTPEEVSEAILTTLEHLRFPSTQDLLGIWFAWRQIEGNANALQKDFKALIPSSIIKTHKFSVGSNSQFCRRASDHYLLKTAPEDWNLDDWTRNGKIGISMSHSYLERMKDAALSFNRHLKHED